MATDIAICWLNSFKFALCYRFSRRLDQNFPKRRLFVTMITSPQVQYLPFLLFFKLYWRRLYIRANSFSQSTCALVEVRTSLFLLEILCDLAATSWLSQFGIFKLQWWPGTGNCWGIRSYKRVQRYCLGQYK